MLSYSIAIRTLGMGGEKFRKELESIKKQTIQPEKVIVYIAEGYPRPEFQIGKEEYVWVKKGMVAQRALDYDDINSLVLFFLDDDVELAHDSAEKMIGALEQNKLDAVGADVFKNHRMTFAQKFYSVLVNGVRPHFNKHWAFRISRNGSFTYNNHPKKNLYKSQSCGGPAWIIKKSVYKALKFQDEIWLDDLGFAYGDDQLETYKIYKNGYKLGVLFNSGITNLDAKSESYKYHNNTHKIYIRTKASFTIWWRSIFKCSDTYLNKFITGFSFTIKTLWTLIPVGVLSIKTLSISPLLQFVRGNIDGWKLVHSKDYLIIPSYII